MKDRNQDSAAIAPPFIVINESPRDLKSSDTESPDLEPRDLFSTLVAVEPNMPEQNGEPTIPVQSKENSTTAMNINNNNSRGNKILYPSGGSSYGAINNGFDDEGGGGSVADSNIGGQNNGFVSTNGSGRGSRNSGWSGANRGGETNRKSSKDSIDIDTNTATTYFNNNTTNNSDLTLKPPGRAKSTQNESYLEISCKSSVFENNDEPEEANTKKRLKFSEIPSRSKWTLLVISIASLCSGLGFSLPAPFYPQESAKKGISPTEVGVVFSIYQLVNFLAFPVFGNYVSEIGVKFLFGSGIAIAGVSSVLFGFLDQSPPGVTYLALSIVIRVVEAIGTAAFTTAAFTIASNEFPDHVSSAFAVLETCIGVGLMVGPTVGGGLFEIGGFGLPFWFVGVAILSNIFLLCGCLPTPIDRAAGQRKNNIFILLRSPLVWIGTILLLAGACSLGFMEPTLSTHLAKFNLTTFQSSLFFVIAPFLHCVTAPLWGYLNDSANVEIYLMMASCVTCAAGYLLIGPSPLLPFLPSDLWVITLGLVVYGSLLGNTIITTMKCIVLGAQELGLPDSLSTYGLVSGLFNTFYYLGAFVGPTISGVLTETVGFEMSCTIIAATFLVVLMIIAPFHCYRRLSRKNDDEKVSLLRGPSRSRTSSHAGGSGEMLSQSHPAGMVAAIAPHSGSGHVGW